MASIENELFDLIGSKGEFYKNQDGNALYYYNVGSGETPMLFLHTLRTQSEFHHKFLPAFVEKYNCYLVDWPGHGRSSMDPNTEYTAQYMVNQVIEFIEEKNLSDLIIVGESIGATGALSIAAKIPQRVRSAYASNPYDEGLIIGKPMGKVVSWLAQYVSEVGKTEMRPITQLLMAGGFHDKTKLDRKFIDLISNNAKTSKFFGNAFNSVLANQKSWHTIRKTDYSRIPKDVRVVLNYSLQDWSSKWVRQENANNIGGNLKVVYDDKVGHFSFLERPGHMVDLIQKGED